MKNSFQKFMLMLLALFLVLSPVSPVLAADEQDDPQPSLEKGGYSAWKGQFYRFFAGNTS